MIETFTGFFFFISTLTERNVEETNNGNDHAFFSHHLYTSIVIIDTLLCSSFILFIWNTVFILRRHAVFLMQISQITIGIGVFELIAMTNSPPQCTKGFFFKRPKLGRGRK